MTLDGVRVGTGLTGHRFKPGPIGLVRYYARHQELRLGPPLTITKTNADRYANTF